jgi:hypothetical protein
MTMLEWTERYTGAYATPDLVGRAGLLAEIEEILRSPGSSPQVVMVVGDGGIGKTRLLRTALTRAVERDDLSVAEDIVDLYDIPAHSRNGMVDAIVHQLFHANPAAFRRYEHARQQLLRRQETGDLDEIAALREGLMRTFVEDLRALSSQKRIVLAFDTAERLVYGAGQVPELFPQVADSWEWVCETLQDWGEVTVLVAGRAPIVYLRPPPSRANCSPRAHGRTV